MIGMYVHTHWSYHRPYSARNWTRSDWSYYLEGLARLGFNAVKIWPQMDTMPIRPTPSDYAYLNTLAEVIDLAHGRYGMKVILVLAANCIGNAKAADYDFASRPYFLCEKRIDPKDPSEVEALLQARRNQFEPVRRADAIAIIDSDPGGYIDSTHEEFVRLCAEQTRVFRELNPRGEFIYWMLIGWECYGRFWKAQRDEVNPDTNPWNYQGPQDFEVTLALMKDKIREPWGLLAWQPEHERAVDRHGLREKTIFYPYGAVEGEPTFPLIVCYAGMEKIMTRQNLQTHPVGVMANAQTHCLQLPHTYLFSHLAGGGAMADLDFSGFAERLIRGQGECIAGGWNAIETHDPELQVREAKRLRSLIGKPHVPGDLSGLLFGEADRFLLDLAMNLELRAALNVFKTAVNSGKEARESLRGVLEHFTAYQRRVGFVDAYGGVLYEALNEPLKKMGSGDLGTVLNDFDDWRNPAVRNGIVPRLIGAIRTFLEKEGKT